MARVDRIEGQEVVFEQGVEDRAAALFDGYRDAALGMLGAQLEKERIQRGGFLLQEVGLRRPGAVGAHRQTMFLVSPVQADPGKDRRCRDGGGWRRRSLRNGWRDGWRDGLCGRLCAGLFHSIMVLVSRETLARRRPYSGPLDRRPLRIRFGPKRETGSESLSRCIPSQGPGDSSSQSRVTPFGGAKVALLTSKTFHRAKVIHRRLRGVAADLSSPPMNNFGTTIRAGVRSGHPQG